MPEALTSDLIGLLDDVLDSLDAHGVLSARVKLGALDLEVSMGGARLVLSPAADANADSDDDLSDVDPRFALERLNFDRGVVKAKK